MVMPRWSPPAFALAMSLGIAAPAFAQRAFLEIPEIPGDSVVEDFEGWIEVISIRQNTAGTAKKSAACDVSVVKSLDSAGPALWAAAATGTTFAEMTIVVLKNGVASGAGGLVARTLYEIRLTNTRIGSVQSTAAASDFSETVTMLPQDVMITFFTQNPDGTPGTPISKNFSCQ